MLDERDARFSHQPLPPAVAALGLIFALAASVLLRYSALAVSVVWPSTAAVCLAANRATRARRP